MINLAVQNRPVPVQRVTERSQRKSYKIDHITLHKPSKQRYKLKIWAICIGIVIGESFLEGFI